MGNGFWDAANSNLRPNLDRERCDNIPKWPPASEITNMANRVSAKFQFGRFECFGGKGVSRCSEFESANYFTSRLRYSDLQSSPDLLSRFSGAVCLGAFWLAGPLCVYVTGKRKAAQSQQINSFPF